MNINHDYHKNNNTSTGINKQLFIICHHTWVIWEWNINVLWGLTDREVSCHYLVMQDWRTYQFVDDDKISWHCWLSRYTVDWNTFNRLNNYSIGIEIESDWKIFTDIQRWKVKELITSLKSSYWISVENILTHKDISWYRGKWDVGDSFRNNKYSSWKDYQNSFLSPVHSLEEQQKRMLINNQMNLNSIMYNKVNDKQLKEMMSDMNDRYRELWFDN